MLFGMPINKLIACPWFEGYSSRLMNMFEDDKVIVPPEYIIVFAAIFENLEQHSEILIKFDENKGISSNQNALNLYKVLLVNILRATVKKNNNEGFELSEENNTKETLKDISTLVNEMTDLTLDT